MAINEESVRWASQNETDATSGLSNKVDPTASQKNSGLKREEPIPRQYLNHQFNASYEALVDLQSQITALTLDAGSGLIGQIFPVGAYYITENTQDPATTLGVGTWVRVKGKFLVGLDEDDTDFDGVGEEGGSKNHTHTNTLSVAGHAITPSQLPSHSHDFTRENTSGLGSAGAQNGTSSFETATTQTTGGNQPHTHGLNGGINTASNIPPYRAVYFWRRSA
jgi:hypothetical protein